MASCVESMRTRASPSGAGTVWNVPCSSRLYQSTNPSPSHHNALMRSRRLLTKRTRPRRCAAPKVPPPIPERPRIDALCLAELPNRMPCPLKPPKTLFPLLPLRSIRQPCHDRLHINGDSYQPVNVARPSRMVAVRAHDPLAKIDRFNRHQEPHLWSDLQHHRPSQRVRPRATRSGTWPAGSSTRSVEPVRSENPSTQGLGNSGPGVNSVNAGGGLDRPLSATGNCLARSRFFSL